jgi:hypothetical protein
MPIFYSDGREATTTAQMREALNVPGGECLGCWLGDAAPEMHDIPDACEYLGGFIYELPTEGEDPNG